MACSISIQSFPKSFFFSISRRGFWSHMFLFTTLLKQGKLSVDEWMNEFYNKPNTYSYRVHCGRDCMLDGFTTTCTCEFEPRSWRGVLSTTLCDKVCQWLMTGRWFSPGTLVSTTNKIDFYDITEILLKVVLNTINQTKPYH